MKSLKNNSVWPYRISMLPLILAIAFIGGCADYLPFSFGKLPGKELPYPDYWDQLAVADIIQLETRLEDPYTINLWIISMENQLYIHAGENKTEWVTHMENDPVVRVGFNDRIFRLKAERVKDQTIFDKFNSVYEAKYGYTTRVSELHDGLYFFRLNKLSQDHE